jgi:hypothetical protein
MDKSHPFPPDILALYYQLKKIRALDKSIGQTLDWTDDCNRPRILYNSNLIIHYLVYPLFSLTARGFIFILVFLGLLAFWTVHISHKGRRRTMCHVSWKIWSYQGLLTLSLRQTQWVLPYRLTVISHRHKDRRRKTELSESQEPDHLVSALAALNMSGSEAL